MLSEQGVLLLKPTDEGARLKPMSGI